MTSTSQVLSRISFGANVPTKLQPAESEIDTPSTQPSSVTQLNVAHNLQVTLSTEGLTASQINTVETLNPSEDVKPVESKSQNNPYASSILGFISAQLQRDLADHAQPDALQLRLEAGLSGFLEGYEQGMAVLGNLPADVRDQLQATKDQVLQGLKGLAEELNLTWNHSDLEPKKVSEPPVISAPETVKPDEPINVLNKVDLGQTLLNNRLRDLAIIQEFQHHQTTDTYAHLGRKLKGVMAPGQVAAGVRESRDFSLKLRTQEGDWVNINLSSMASQAAVSKGSHTRSESTEQSRFEFSVEGDLNEKELAALNDLLSQVSQVSDAFFSQDFTQALTSAAGLQFDDSQIAQFDVALQWQQTAVMTETSEETSSAPKPLPQWEAISRHLMIAQGLAEQFGQSSHLVLDLLEWMNPSKSAAIDAQNPHEYDPLKTS